MYHCTHTIQSNTIKTLFKSFNIFLPIQFYRSFARRSGSKQWYKTIKEQYEYQQFQELYKESRVPWKQPYQMSDSVVDKLINILPSKESHKRQQNWENYLHILRRLERKREFKDWDEEQPFSYDQKSYNQDYIRLYSEENCYAYTQYKYAVTMRLLEEIKCRRNDFNPKTILNFGSGPGAEIAAMNQFFSTSKQYTCIDMNDTMNEICQYINASSTISYYKSLIQMIQGKEHKYDFILCNNVLSELCSDKEKASVVILLYEFLKPGGLICLSERGSRYGFHTIRNARKLLLSLYSQNPNSDITLLSPCTHCLECPLKGNKNRWCYFKQQPCAMPNRASQSSLVLSEPFSYVIFQKGSHQTPLKPSYNPPTANRILLDPLKRDQHVILDVCTHQGNFERRTYTKRKMEDRIEKYRAIRKADFGGLLYDYNQGEEEELLHHINALKYEQNK